MNGSVFIINEKGLYCSNDADLLIEKIPIRDDNGKLTGTKERQVIRVMNFMNISGILSDNEDVYAQFLFDTENQVKTFSAVINGFTPEMMILNLKAVNLHDNEILNTIKNKIKEEINHG